jgi:dihydroneopterin aldolase/D-erythro-7,8-dihydroneopterin triphosphate epimerase
MDRLLIDDLLVRCILGVTAEERREKQDVRVSVALGTDVREAARTDSLEHAVDYRALKKRLARELEASSYHLVEALAERVAAICLEDPRVLEARVRVEKPGSLRFARTAGVEIVRARTED